MYPYDLPANRRRHEPWLRRSFTATITSSTGFLRHVPIFGGHDDHCVATGAILGSTTRNHGSRLHQHLTRGHTDSSQLTVSFSQYIKEKQGTEQTATRDKWHFSFILSFNSPLQHWTRHKWFKLANNYCCHVWQILCATFAATTAGCSTET